MSDENIDKQQIRNLIQNRLAKLGITVIDAQWEKNWKTHWVGFTIDQEPMSRRETNLILAELEKDLWQWDKVKYLFYLKYKKVSKHKTDRAFRHGKFLTPKEWDEEFKLNKIGSVNKNVWRIESV